MTAKLIEITELPIRQIDVAQRLRPVSEVAVISLMASIEEIGLQSEIHVRRVRHQGGKLKLIAGGHRLEAVSRLGCTSIMAKVWDCTDDWATMAEIDDNLAHTDLAPLDLAVFLAARKEVYERLYPEAKHGGSRGNQHTGGRQNDILSFCQSTAESRDMSKRQIERLVSVGQALDRNAISQLRRAPNKVTLTDLQAIAKCGDPADRSMICTALADGTAKTAADALAQKKLKDRPGDAIKDPADVDAARIADAFARASKEGQRRFVRDQIGQLRALLAQHDNADTPASIVPFSSRKRDAS